MQHDEIQPREGVPAKWETAPSTPVWSALLPVSVVALGSAEQPVERLLTLQSAIAKGVHLATVVARLRPTLRHAALPRLRFR
jgi:hypothetical protein